MKGFNRFSPVYCILSTVSLIYFSPGAAGRSPYRVIFIHSMQR
jgi:hypothetical protein